MKARAYIELAKPRVLLGMVALFIASTLASSSIEGCQLNLALLAWATVVASSLVAGANVLNNYFDRHLDALMYRTRRRPLPSGRVGEQEALVLGLALTLASLVSIAYLALHVLWVALLGLASYLAAYTLWLKLRSWLAVASATPAVASPVLAGWLVGAGRITMVALLYSSVAALWGLMHFWALATVFKEDYRRARVPTLASRLSAEASARVVALLALIVAALATATALMSSLSLLALTFLALLNAVLLILACELAQRPRAGRRAWRLYKFSSPYIVLVLLSTAIQV